MMTHATPMEKNNGKKVDFFLNPEGQREMSLWHVVRILSKGSTTSILPVVDKCEK